MDLYKVCPLNCKVANIPEPSVAEAIKKGKWYAATQNGVRVEFYVPRYKIKAATTVEGKQRRSTRMSHWELIKINTGTKTLSKASPLSMDELMHWLPAVYEKNPCTSSDAVVEYHAAEPPAPTPVHQLYFERQRRDFCALHATNNAVQYCAFRPQDFESASLRLHHAAGYDDDNRHPHRQGYWGAYDIVEAVDGSIAQDGQHFSALDIHR